MGTPTEITYADIQGVVKTLMGQSAKMFTPNIEGAAKFGTAPVRAAFWAMAHTDILDDLEDIDEFTSVANYPAKRGIADSEWGAIGNTRWLLSPLGYESSSIYSCFIVGRDAYGVSKIEQGVSGSIFKPLGHGDDPLNQRCTQGWKTYYAARILNDNWMVNLKVTHS